MIIEQKLFFTPKRLKQQFLKLDKGGAEEAE